MKIKIDKDPAGVTIEIVTDTSKKPLKKRLTNQEFAALLALLETAARADKFSFTYEA